MDSDVNVSQTSRYCQVSRQIGHNYFDEKFTIKS